MPIGPRKKDHPIFAYVMGLVFLVISFCVGAGVAYHLTLSHHGPGLLRPFVKRHEVPEFPVLNAAQRQAKLDRHEHFHNIVRYARLEEEKRPLCLICHSEMPHNQNKRVRALLNMHTQYLTCEGCHIKAQADQTIVYQWASPIDPAPKGPFVGTRYDADTGYLAEVDDKFSKITPFFKSPRAGITPAVVEEGRQSARDYMRRHADLNTEQRKIATKAFHETTQAKGPECQACHGEKGIIDYRALQFSDKRIADLIHLNITGLLAKYETWYLPDLLSESRALGEPADQGAPKP